MAHIAGKGMLPFGNFGATLFFTCSGMNTVRFAFRLVVPSLSRVLFFGGGGSYFFCSQEIL